MRALLQRWAKRSADQPEESAAHCAMCGCAVVVDESGRCDLGHRVHQSTAAQLTLAEPSAADPTERGDAASLLGDAPDSPVSGDAVSGLDDALGSLQAAVGESPASTDQPLDGLGPDESLAGLGSSDNLAGLDSDDSLETLNTLDSGEDLDATDESDGGERLEDFDFAELYSLEDEGSDGASQPEVGAVQLGSGGSFFADLEEADHGLEHSDPTLPDAETEPTAPHTATEDGEDDQVGSGLPADELEENRDAGLRESDGGAGLTEDDGGAGLTGDGRDPDADEDARGGRRRRVAGMAAGGTAALGAAAAVLTVQPF
jgi:hypothetical protein